MPFTGSHPAAVLPLLRTPLPASALVAGSIAPDIPYYLPVEFPWPTHTALAVVTTDVLLGALLWALWHAVLAAPALAAAPPSLCARLPAVPLGLRHRLASPPRVAWTLLALVVGAGIHVLWDEFTHPRRWATEQLPALAAAWGPLPVYAWLQHVSSLVGAAVLVVWFLRWWRRTPVRAEPPTPAAWWAWGAIAVSGVLAGGWGALTASGAGMGRVAAATWGVAAMAATGLVLAVAWHLRRRTVRQSL